MAARRILLVDDEEAVCAALAAVLAQRNYDVTSTYSAEAAAAELERGGWDLLITDLRLGAMSGTELLRSALEADPTLAVILMTGHAHVETAVEAMRSGARDFLAKPIAPEELIVRVQAALAHRDLLREVRSLRQQGRGVRKSDVLVGESVAIQRVREQITAVARPSVPVLLLGESGTGKELVARMIHAHSPRQQGPFVAVNCGAIPESLLENELFGHARGAYTGASTDAKGLFERADGGTLFLDEIGEMSPSLQVRLLRVIETGEFERLGGGRSVRANVRIVAATHRDLGRMVREGGFREDLYYRINVIAIRLPPLRERRDDIPLLAEHFRRVACAELGVDRVTGFAPGTLEALAAGDWPGNVRELANFIKRAIVMARGNQITTEGLRTSRPPPPVMVDLARPFVDLKREVVDGFERNYLHQLLSATQGNVAHAARMSGQYPKNLWDLLKKHGLNPDAYRPRAGQARG